MERIAGWLRAGEDWLDGWGRPGWIGAMVVGFVLFWPVGLALLGYMIWSGRMTCARTRRTGGWGRRMTRSTGNSAFDEYREETLRRLEDEQTAFSDFLDRLRKAKDRAEFDRFREERSGGRAGEPETGAA